MNDAEITRMLNEEDKRMRKLIEEEEEYNKKYLETIQELDNAKLISGVSNEYKKQQNVNLKNF